MNRTAPSERTGRARWHHASFIVGFLLPLLLSAAYSYVAAREALAGETLVSPAYPPVLGLALGLPPMLLGGIVISYFCRRPRDARLRLLVGFVLGCLLLYGGQHDWFVF